MNAKSEKDSAGKALYLEFRKDNFTYQVIVTPPAVALAGDALPAMMMERRISSWHPRKNWNFSAAPKNDAFTLPRTAIGNFEEKPADEATVIGALHAQRLLSRTLDSLFHKSWELFKQPVAVEVSYKELATMRSGKTPTDLIRRIERSRKAFNFPEALFDEPTPVPTPAV